MSVLWKHFLNESLEKVRCKYCDTIVSYKNGNRSIMRKHLERKHPQTLGITTQIMTSGCIITNDSDTNSMLDIHPLFQIENNIKYFINMVYQRPTLYRYSRSIGWNSKQNKIFWQEIADTFQVNIIECQKFWKYLKETYDLHSRNPKLDEHKYHKELAFLGVMYKNKRERNEQLAKQRKLVRSLDYKNDTSKYQSNQTTLEKPNTSNTMDGSSYFNEDNYEIYEGQNIKISQIDEIDMNHYKDADVIIKDLNIENEDNSDADSLINSNNILTLSNQYSQTDHSGPINYNTDDSKKTKNYYTSAKCKCYVEELDEIDLLMEFIKSKIRKFSAKEMNSVQIKILKTVIEAENNIKNTTQK